jgi:hypothetical protein
MSAFLVVFSLFENSQLNFLYFQKINNLSFFNAGFHAGFFSNRASLKPGARA